MPTGSFIQFDYLTHRSQQLLSDIPWYCHWTEAQLHTMLTFSSTRSYFRCISRQRSAKEPVRCLGFSTFTAPPNVQPLIPNLQQSTARHECIWYFGHFSSLPMLHSVAHSSQTFFQPLKHSVWGNPHTLHVTVLTHVGSHHHTGAIIFESRSGKHL